MEELLSHPSTGNNCKAILHPERECVALLRNLIFYDSSKLEVDCTRAVAKTYAVSFRAPSASRWYASRWRAAWLSLNSRPPRASSSAAARTTPSRT